MNIKLQRLIVNIKDAEERRKILLALIKGGYYDEETMIMLHKDDCDLFTGETKNGNNT